MTRNELNKEIYGILNTYLNSFEANLAHGKILAQIDKYMRITILPNMKEKK